MATEVMQRPALLVTRPVVRFWSSFLGGQLAGLTMAVVMMGVFALFLGRSPLFPVQVIASLVLGHDALAQATPGVLATGLVVHQLGVALGWSLVFFALTMLVRERMPLNSCLLLGAAVGLASVVIDVYVLGPSLQQVTSGENLWMKHVPRFWDWAAHGVFGLSLGLFFWLVRNALERSRGEVRRTTVPTTVTADDSGTTVNKPGGDQERL